MSAVVSEVPAGGGDQRVDRGVHVRKGKGLAISSLDDVKTVIRQLLYDQDNKTVDRTFEQIEKKVHMKREQIAYVLFALTGLYLIFGAFARLACNMIGFAYPAYASVKAVRTAQKDDDTHWLIYWTVFAAFSIIDFFAEFIFSYFPVYWICKAIFLLYLYLPQTYGALIMYDRFLDPAITVVDGWMQKYGLETIKED
ncbi:unnamed protein product [Gongylonema pulchrum]|uniref:Receptor expression-enhancing protein n=1 Tax=Gongylonema pulchrum TaxID=637853 RepID=A0A183DQP7_9BILA|nr:unnamed protein product [Gongylonema pulchrum]